MQFDKKYLNIALFQLEKIIGSSYPNPPVFSILVESNKSFTDNKIVSFGYTSAGGRPHAEVYIREDTVRALFKLTHFKGWQTKQDVIL